MRVSGDEYTLGKCLREGRPSELWEAVRERDGRLVVLKAYDEDRGKLLRDTWIHAEHETLRAVAGKGIPEVVELVSQDPPILVLQRVPGIPLAEWLAQNPLPETMAFIEIALQLASVLDRVHAAHVIHRDVKPSNILIEPRTLAIQLIDFGIARPLGAGARRSDGALRWEFVGTPQYVAPEQTGWMNRGCDFRSDLYSLGATLYHALTGRTPFEGSTLVEQIHAQIACVPPDPMQLRPCVPEALSRLVLKLLRKEPEERYQSARALHADLLVLREQMVRTGTIEVGLELGGADAPERPRFLRRLYGREAECASLARLLARAAQGEMPAVLIRGEPGMGKSMLVDALRPRLAEARGYLALGKFELGRERPYGAWVAALESFVQQLLVESDARLQRWRDELRTGLGNIARVLVDLVPDLGFIVGEVPAVPPLGPSETQARLALALQRFLRARADGEHPLVVFLDDLQWSDAGSLFLLEELLSGDPIPGLLLVGALRRDEVSSVGRLEASLQRLEARRVPLERIELQALTSESVLAMLTEALGRDARTIQPLVALIERKTGNLPLLVRQFVEDMHERGLLRYERGTGWAWDATQIAAADIPDGAVALMTGKIQRLEAGSRAVLQFASCIGAEFDVELLCELGGGERIELVTHLYKLCDAGLLAPCSSGFRFTHDRIREAVQSSLSGEERARLHYDTARLLLARVPEAELSQRAFELAEHLNRGLALVEEDLRATVIRLNFTAGEQAMAAGAAMTAAPYLAVARRLFREEDWQSEGKLGFALHLLCAERAFQCGEFGEAQDLLDALDRRPLSRMELVGVAVKRTHLFALTREPEECVRYSLSVLRGFGIRWPMRPSALRVRWSMRRLLRLLSRRDPDMLPERPAQLDPSWGAPLLLVSVAGSPMLRVDVHLAALVACYALRTILRKGWVVRTGYGLAAFAFFVYAILGDAERARRLASLARDWSQRVPDPLYAPRTEFQIDASLNPWLMPRREALAPVPLLAEAASEVGDPEFAYYARFLATYSLALAGDELKLAEQRLRALADAVARSGHQYPSPGECCAVLGLLLEPGVVPFEQLLEESDARLAGGARSAEPYVRTLWLLVLCVYGRYDLALAQSDTIGERLFRVPPYVHIADHTFYRGLACAALAGGATLSRRRRLRTELRRCLRRMRGWAKHGPDFVHMAALLDAEVARLQGDVREARWRYERAAQRALEQRFPHHAALAHERRARMLLELRRETEASTALAHAIALYRDWGVEAKVLQLTEKRR